MTHAAPNPGRIRVMHCIGALIVGGAEGQLTELICRLPRERFEQELLLIQEGGAHLPRVRAAGIPVHELHYAMRHGKFDPRCYRDFGYTMGAYVRRLRDFRPHILHAQLYWPNVLSVLAGRLAGIPVIVTSRLSLGEFKRGRPRMQQIENLANRFTTAVFANSEAVRRDALDRERNLPRRIQVIHNGVDLAVHAPADSGPLRREFALVPGELVLMTVANLHPYKGHDDLLRAIAALSARHPNLRVLLPGRDQGMRPALERMTAELGLTGKVHLLGERADVPRLLALADIVVHPSHQEGFSNSILEAMAAGKPLVVTDVGGNPEAVCDGVEGFVVPPRDPAALAGALEKLIADGELRRRMGQAARRRIEERFSLEIMIERFAAWYESLVAGA